VNMFFGTLQGVAFHGHGRLLSGFGWTNDMHLHCRHDEVQPNYAYWSRMHMVGLDAFLQATSV
jgi:hypothetical protein